MWGTMIRTYKNKLTLIQAQKSPLQLKQAFTLAVFLMRPQADLKSALSDESSEVNRLGDDEQNVNLCVVMNFDNFVISIIT